MVLIRPHKATHALLTSANNKKALVEISDLDCLNGTEGTIQWMRLTDKSREILGSTKFDGKIEDIQNDYRKKRIKRK